MKINTKHIKTLFVSSFMLLTFNSVKSQQISLFNNNIINPYSINPARAGLENNQLFFQHRKELVGVQGAPETSLLSAEFRLAKSKSAIGFKVMNENANVIRNTSGYMTYASHFKLSAKQNLSFGLSLGVRYNGIAFDKVNVLEREDGVLFNGNQSSTNFDGNFGVNYQFGNLEVQLAGLQLFGSKSVYNNSFDQKELNYSFIRHFYSSVGYQFFKDKKLKVKPIIQVRGAQGLPFLPEAIIRFDYNDFIWLAGHYRNNATWAATAGLNISERFIVGYSAEFSTNKLSQYNGGTHEIIFGFKLTAPHKKSVSSSRLKQIEKSNKSYEERLEYLNQQNKKMEDEANKLRKRLKELENSSTKLDYNKIKKLIEESKRDENKTSVKEEEVKKKVQDYAKSIQFETGSNTISQLSLEPLNKVAKALNENLEATAVISGHTDNLGSAKTNKKLSLKRADAVKNYLVSKGVAEKRITTFGYGGTKPVKSNNTTEGRKENRRVEIELVFL